MRRHRVGKLGIVGDLADRGDRLLGNLLVELHIALELGHHRPHQGLDLVGVGDDVGHDLGPGFEEFLARREAIQPGALGALDQHLDGAVGQLQQLQNGRKRADAVELVGGRVVIGRVALRHEKNPLILAHHLLQRANGLLAADEQRHDHMREYDDVAQRQHRVNVLSADRGRPGGGFDHLSSLSGVGPRLELPRDRALPGKPAKRA